MTHTRRAFSLVEILIVVVILGILAAIAIPKFANASQSAKESSVKTNLQQLRTQINVYRTQHSLFPGYPGGDQSQTPTAQATSDQLTLFTDDMGNTSATGSITYKWSPYITQMPDNSVNNLNTWTILGPYDAFTPDGTTGWLYQPSTGIIQVNLTGTDSTGRNYSDY